MRPTVWSRPFREQGAASAPPADQRLIASLRKVAADAVGSLLANETTCALVGFPNHNNAGDSGIWLGELALLRRLGVAARYVADDASYDPRDLTARVPHGPILLHGGGNYGDLWPFQQAFRERVLADFPSRPVVQLPQTVHFESDAAARRHRTLLHARPAPPALLCRDHRSLAFVRQELGVQGILCPDLAFFLPLPRRTAPVVDVVVNQRLDHEAADRSVPGLRDLSMEHRDWLPCPNRRHPYRALTVRVREHVRVLAGGATSSSRAHRLVRRAPMLASERLARRRVAGALGLLSRGRVVVTDRLHGHIFCTLLGIPHVLLDTAHHKVRDFHETFTSACSTAAMADADEDVAELVHVLLRTSRSR